MGIRARSDNLVEKERKGERDVNVLANSARITNMCFGGLPRAGSRDWPANFEPGMGMLLPDETYEERSSFNSISNNTTEDLFDNIDEFEAAKALAVLQKCDDFLKRHGIRPEFFCRHRERLALQSWLLQKSKLSSGDLLFCSETSLKSWGFALLRTSESQYKEKFGLHLGFLSLLQKARLSLEAH
ncbi:unconventional myosin-Va isoform X1 [Vespula maculifrons]|uniref:Uncharacterized protein n=2 Tax=Vespula TaxID=7451 RepID=A0A834MYQ5_VESGE|nr:hypothetical protein HZH68_012611 [Vespula germanica]